MTWSEQIAIAAKQLRTSGIEESKLNAELLAACVLNVWDRSAVRRELSRVLALEEVTRYQQLLERRINREPLQYIVGETEFYGLRLLTTNVALIPRPETEILVEEVLKEVRSRGTTSARILDIGTGSGAIALAIATHLPNAQLFGIDISDAAIDLAKKNQERLALTNITFEQKDIFRDLSSLGSFDAIVSNPPYIPILEMPELEPELREHEPHIALTDGNDGLSFYRKVAELAPMMLRNNGFLAVEIGFGASDNVTHILRQHGLSQIRLINDLAGIPRVFMGEIDQNGLRN